MSDYNYNNQTPPENGNRPDYSYNWNGSEYNRNGKNNGGKFGAIIAIVLSLLAIIVVVVAIASRNSDYVNDDGSTNDESKTVSQSGNTSGESSKPDVSIPSFTPSDDADIDLSTKLTQIYDNCAPSCCTVNVTYNGQGYSIGSGFVIDAEGGYIATNHHVIDGGDSITVTFYDGREYDTTLVGSDSVTDIAVLQIDAENLVQVEFGNSKNVKIGENVVAIGTPYDTSLAGTMTCGIVSGIARDIEITNSSGKVVKTMTLIQTDCSINPGNSGGPLIDMAGNVIGITSLKLVDEQFEGIGFAIPITSAVEIFQKLIAGEDIDGSDIATASPKIGVEVINAKAGFDSFRFSPYCEYPENGLLIVEIEFTSSAYMAGLSRYDIITDFNGHKIESVEDLTNALSKFKAGDTVEVTVFRFNNRFTAGEYTTIKFKLDAAE